VEELADSDDTADGKEEYIDIGVEDDGSNTNGASVSTDTRHIHKISSVCNYCRCSAVVAMACMRAKFVGPLGRHRCHLQVIRPRLHVDVCVYNVQEN
jgi:hypothetical protein